MDLKPWACAENKNHILGLVQRNGSNVRQLLLYRQAVDATVKRIEPVDVIAVVEGYVTDVRCSICGAARTWVPGEEAIRHLLERTGKHIRVAP